MNENAENPEATEAEQEQAQEGRLQEEEAMRYPHHAPDVHEDDEDASGDDE
jgi:hypothetical protein